MIPNSRRKNHNQAGLIQWFKTFNMKAVALWMPFPTVGENFENSRPQIEEDAERTLLDMSCQSAGLSLLSTYSGPQLNERLQAVQV